MRKLLIVVAIFASVFLNGCSLLNEVNNSLDYVSRATEHVNTWNDFGQEAQQLIQDAATNTEAKAELETKLNAMLEEINEFTNIDPPALAEGIHQQIAEKNEAIKVAIQNAMTNGELSLEKLKDSQMFTLINEVTVLIDKVKDLGL